jgi:hypothetical protein
LSPASTTALQSVFSKSNLNFLSEGIKQNRKETIWIGVYIVAFAIKMKIPTLYFYLKYTSLVCHIRKVKISNT